MGSVRGGGGLGIGGRGRGGRGGFIIQGGRGGRGGAGIGNTGLRLGLGLTLPVMRRFFGLI